MRDRAQVVTPEGVAFSYEVAGIGSRFAAFAVDLLLVGTGSLLLWSLFLLLVTVLEVVEAAAWFLAAFLIAQFVLAWSYFILFEILWTGQTPGKRWLGLRVVRDNGTPIGVWEAIARNLLLPVDFLPGGIPFGVGMVVMFCNLRSKRVGDYVAGTMVMREVDYAIPTLSAISGGAQEISPDEFPLPPDALRRLKPQEMEMIRRFLERREDLPQQTRQQLSAQVAFPLADRLQVAHSLLAGEQLERFLEYLWTQYQGQSGWTPATTPDRDKSAATETRLSWKSP